MTRGNSNDDYADLDIDDEDDDDMKLDNILSSIVDDTKGDAMIPSLDNQGKNSDLLELINGNSVKFNHRTAAAEATSSSVVERNVIPAKISVSSVDFGNDTSRSRDMTPIQNSSAYEAGSISPVSEEDNGIFASAMFDDSVSSHTMIAQTDEEPAFASVGFKDATRFESSMHPPTSEFRQNGGNNGGGVGGSGSLLSIIEDDICYRDSESVKPLTMSTSNALTPPMGRFSSYSDRRRAQVSPRQTANAEDPAHKKSHDAAPQSFLASKNNSECTPASHSKFTTQNHVDGVIVHNETEVENLSTVTDPTEAPFICTYKKSHDDDTISQITSSLAGSSASSYLLQNVPNSSSMRNQNAGLSWMKSNNDGHRTGGMVIAGLYGRDRNRKSPKLKSSSRRSGYSRWNNKGSSNSGSGSAGSDSYDGERNNLDEIEYALNADCSSRRNQRSMVTRRPLSRIGSASGGDDLSTVVSKNSRESIQGDHQTVSRLGMGGVSCAAQSVYSEQSVYTDATSDSTRSLSSFQRLALLCWKAQHYVGRFFFPTSRAASRKKSDDPMSDLEDILLEEGANTLSHRHRRGGRGGHDTVGDDDDIDYFSRAMSISNNHKGLGGWRKSKKEKRQVKTARLGCLVFIMAAAFALYSMSQKESGNYIKRQNKNRGFRAGKRGRSYDSSQHGNGQDLDYAIIADGDRLEGAVENSDQKQKHSVQYNLQLPPVFNDVANVDDLFYQKGIDLPFYWHIPRSGGGMMNDVLGRCLHLTLAADVGGSEGHDQQEDLEVLHFSHKVSYVNVDTSTHQGIGRAKRLNLVSTGLADVLISPLLHEASTLFTPTRKGRMFTIFRHPVERAASLFYFIQETQWRQPATRSDQLADISIEQFYKSGFAENNWVVRFLTNELTKDELAEDDLITAKEILRQKCLVGLLEEKGETFARLQNYFGWGQNDEGRSCIEKKLDWSWPMKHKHPAIEKDSTAWSLIVANNSFDMKLYDFAKDLFHQQGQQLFPQQAS